MTTFEALFAESAARAIVAVPRTEEVRFTDLCTARGVPSLRIGATDDSASAATGGVAGETAAGDGPALVVEGLLSVPLTELAEAHRATLPRHFG